MHLHEGPSVRASGALMPARQQMRGLGFDPVTTLFTGMALKNLLGIGVKKKKLKAIEGQAKGYWTAQYPSDIDWKLYLDGAHGKTAPGLIRSEYEKLRKKKDTTLIKHNIATPEDYAAWHFTQWGVPDIQKGGTAWIPFSKSGVRYDKIADPTMLSTPAAAPSITVPAPVATALAPLLNLQTPAVQAALQPTTLNPQQQFMPVTPTIIDAGSSSGAGKAALPSWALPAMIAAGLGAVLLVMKKKGR